MRQLAVGSAVDRGGNDIRQLVRRQPAFVHDAGLLRESPVDSRSAETGRQGEGDFAAGAAITRTGASMRRHGRACASRRLSAICALPTAAPMAWSSARSVASGTCRRLPKSM